MGEVLPFPKPERLTSEAYLQFIRERLCLVPGCGAQAEPHHLVSRGAGGPDYLSVPLCRAHHAQAHSEGSRAWEAWGIDRWRAAATCLMLFAAVLERSRG